MGPSGSGKTSFFQSALKASPLFGNIELQGYSLKMKKKDLFQKSDLFSRSHPSICGCESFRRTESHFPGEAESRLESLLEEYSYSKQRNYLLGFSVKGNSAGLHFFNNDWRGQSLTISG